LKEVQ